MPNNSVNVRLSASELRLAEPSVETEYELSGADHEILRKAIQHYQDHLDGLARDIRRFDGIATQLAPARGRLDNLYDRIVFAHSIKIETDR